MDGGTGEVYIWCEGLDWTDIDTEGLIYKGAFKKDYHDRYHYSFSLIDRSRTLTLLIPQNTINSDTWANHRTEGGGGSVAGKSQPIVLGDWPKRVPLNCVDTSAYKYQVAAGFMKSVDADYTAGTENVYGIVGLAKALEIAYDDLSQNQKHIESLKTRMIKGLKKAIPGVKFNGLCEDMKASLYSVLSVSLPPSDKNEMILFQLDLNGIAASGGSACGSGALKGSHVINAMKGAERRGARQE